MDCNAIIPDKDHNGKWGYSDGKFSWWREFIPHIYNGAMPMHDGICWVKHLNWGAIDCDGNVIIPFIYQSVYRIAPNLYRVLALNGKYGLLDNYGNIILSSIYDSIIIEEKSILVLKYKGAIEYKNLQGETLFDDLVVKDIIYFNSWTQIFSDSGTYIYWKQDKRITVPENLTIQDSNDKFVLLIAYMDEKKYFIYNTDGQLILEYTRSDDNGYYFASLCNDTLIFQTEQGLIFHNLCSHTEVLIEQAEQFNILDNNYIVIINKEKKFGIIDINGRIIIPCIYNGLGTSFGNERIYADFYCGRYIAASIDGETCGVIDFDQNIIIPFEYSTIIGIEGENDILIAKNNGKSGIITIDNHKIVDFEYNSISNFYNGVAIARKEGKDGAIDIQGNIIIPFEYDKIEDFYISTEGVVDYAIAKQGNSFTVYDICGNITFEGKDNKIICLNRGFLEVSKSFHSFLHGITRFSIGCCDVYGYEITSCDLLKENHSFIMNLGDELLTIPIIRHFHALEVDIDSIKDDYAYYTIDKISKDRYKEICRSIPHGNLLVEFNGYYTYSITEANNPMGCRMASIIVNPERKIIFTSLCSTISAIAEDENYIYFKYDDSDYCNQLIIVDKQTHDLRETLHAVDSENLSIIEKNGKYGAWHKELGLVTLIKYDKVNILKNIVLAIKEDDLFLLFNGYLPIKEMNIDKTFSFYYELRTISSDFIGLYYDDCVVLILDVRGKCYECMQSSTL